MKHKVALHLGSARENLIDAGVLIEARRYPAVLNRTYYAVFSAASAMLLEEGLEFESHYGVKVNFSKVFVKSGKVDARFSEIFSNAFDWREDADYAPEARARISQVVAEQELQRASEFVAMAEKFLEGTGGSAE